MPELHRTSGTQSLRVRLPYVQEFRDRHGKLHRYFRRKGFPSVPLPGRPGSPEFQEAYYAALAAMRTEKPPAGLAKSVPGSLTAAIAAYYTHDSFLYGFSPQTQGMRRAILERFRAEHGDKRLALLRREHSASLLGAKKPYAARNWLKSIRGLMQFCLETGLIQEDPTAGIKLAKTGASPGFHSWTEAEIAQYEARHPIGTRARLAMALVLYTAQRRSDVVRMGPQHVQGRTIVVRAQKTSRTTGKILEIPIHPALTEVLSATPSTHLTFLMTAAGATFSPAGFGNLFRERCNEAGLRNCTAHGLRKAQLRRLAEAGCSEHQIAAISGHESLGEIRRYTRAAEQARGWSTRSSASKALSAISSSAAICGSNASATRSCACPGVRRNLKGLPSASTRAWIFVAGRHGCGQWLDLHLAH